MLHDFAGSNHEFYDTTGTTNVEEAPNDSAKEFYEAIVENGAPIYPGCTKYTILSFTRGSCKSTYSNSSLTIQGFNKGRSRWIFRSQTRSHHSRQCIPLCRAKCAR